MLTRARRRRSSRSDLRQAGVVPTARAPGRVTIIGDHTDYNGGLSLPMAIDLATEVDLHAEAGQLPRRRSTRTSSPAGPSRLPLGDTAPVADEPPGGRTPPRSTPPSSGGHAPRSPARCPSVRASPRAPPSRSPSCSPSATTTTRSHSPAPARRPSAPRLARRAARSPRDRRRQPGHALLIDFATLETHPVARARRGGLRHRAQRVARACSRPPPTPPGGPSASGPRTSWGGRSARCELGDLSALTDPVLRRRARHVVTECARVREAERLLRPGRPAPALGAVMTEGHRSLAGDYRVSVPAVDELVEHLLAQPGRARGPHDRRGVRRVRHRPVPARLARTRSRRARAAAGLAGQPGCRRSASCDVATSASSTPKARPLSIDSAASASPSSRSSTRPATTSAAAALRTPMSRRAPRLALEHGADDPGVEGGVAAAQVGHGRRAQTQARPGPPASR